MAQKKKQRDVKKSTKVGSDPEALKEVGGKGDFGVPAGEAGPDRNYTTANTKASDRGASQPNSSEFSGDRTHGAGGKASGVGSSSGGDLDTDFIGVGTGSGLAASPPSCRPGADDTDGTSDEMGTGRSKGENREKNIGSVGGPRPVHRSIAQANAGASEPGASDTARGPEDALDDSFRGDVTSGEARGEDVDPDNSPD